jgi:hypothetical protein
MIFDNSGCFIPSGAEFTECNGFREVIEWEGKEEDEGKEEGEEEKAHGNKEDEGKEDGKEEETTFNQGWVLLFIT